MVRVEPKPGAVFASSIVEKDNDSHYIKGSVWE